ncbi:hypothetical protein ABZ519_37500 [Streptomyces collinus]|uniref:hypothetical protein n=1 Tax=Streptomyces collinus TaxID=42684 RepID=UPI0033D61165
MFLRLRSPIVIVLRANLRRQAGPLAALVVAGVLVAVAWDGLYARGRWADTGWVYIGEMCGGAARTVGVGFAVLLAGWQGGSEARDEAGWVATTSARGSVTYQLMGLASGVGWPLAGYVLAMTVMVVSPYPQEPVGRAPLDLMAVDAVMLTAFSCVAYLVGRTVPLPGVSVPLTAAGVVLSVSPWAIGCWVPSPVCGSPTAGTGYREERSWEPRPVRLSGCPGAGPPCSPRWQ